MKHLGNPENKFKSVHVAGTNGKGSTSHMFASILQEAGYKVGLYTSPHLIDFRERVKINGIMIPEAEVIHFVEQNKIAFEKIEPSFFEWTVALAFNYFAQEKVDIAIIEVGLGGRLDSTNVISPLISIITNIGLDHTSLLGGTKELIAREKAGIIKSNVPVIISQRQKETEHVFISKAQELNASIQFASDIYETKEILKEHSSLKVLYKNGIEYTTDLKGSYQSKNIPGVILGIEELKKAGFKISDEAVNKGLNNVVKNTGLLGRWQTISETPKIICDTGHNEDGIKEVLENIALEKFGKLHFVMGMVNDKDPDKVLQMLPKDAIYYFCKPNIPRGLEASELEKKAFAYQLKGSSYSSVKEALRSAKSVAKSNDLIFVGGSTFVVADLLQ